jgi:hypothetical protein
MNDLFPVTMYVYCVSSYWGIKCNAVCCVLYASEFMFHCKVSTRLLLPCLIRIRIAYSMSMSISVDITLQRLPVL